jgi:shikimate 5-dehydrogenase
VLFRSGLRMLVFQALASCAYWTGRDIPGDIVSLKELQAIVEASNAKGDAAA